MGETGRNNTMPIVVLVLGIFGILGGGFVTGLPAWLLGNAEMKNWANGSSEYTMVQIGRIMGMVVTILSVIALCIGLLFFLGIGGLIFYSAPR